MPGTLSFMPPDCYDQWLRDYQSQAANKIKLLVNKARQEEVRCHAVILTGLPEDAIASAVLKAKIDLVVIGTHGRRGLSRLLSGSIASRVIPRAGCPVLTIRVAPSMITSVS
jgi:universal stress protein A